MAYARTWDGGGFADISRIYSDAPHSYSPLKEQLVSVELVPIPGEIQSLEEFIAPTEETTIRELGGLVVTVAIDDPVRAKSGVLERGTRIIRGHHYELTVEEREQGPASCEQVWDDLCNEESELHIIIRNGTTRANEKVALITPIINDRDQDASLGAVLVEKGHFIIELLDIRKDPSHPQYINAGLMLERAYGLVHATSRMDATSCAAVYTGEVTLEQRLLMASMYKDYMDDRLNGTLNTGSPFQKAAAIERTVRATGKRFMEYMLHGTYEEQPLDTRYEVVAQCAGLAAVIEIGPHARGQMFLDGIERFISVSMPGANGERHWAFGKRDSSVSGDMDLTTRELNKREAEVTGMDYCTVFGHGGTSGGSQRQPGSKQLPRQIITSVHKGMGLTDEMKFADNFDDLVF